MIIDSHMHLGEDLIFNTDDTEEDILAYFEEWGIGGAILQPGILPKDFRAAHQRIYEFAKKYPKQIWGCTQLSPYMEEKEYADFARWTVEELGFKALKIQPFAWCANPNSPQAAKVFETAADLKVPVIIHTGNGIPVAMPSLAIPIAKRYPEMKIVLAHSGAGMYGMEALIAAQQCPNIYLETSWTTVLDIKSYVESLGSERVMFGTDVPLNAGAELGKYKALHLSDKQYEDCYSETARRVFNL